MGENKKYAVVLSMSRGGHNWIMNVLRSWLGSTYVFHRIEAVVPARYKELVVKNLGLVEFPDWPVYVVHRDYLNWAASYFNLLGIPKGQEADPNQVMKKADIWFAIYQEAMDGTNYVPNKVVICYDSMVKSRDYRKFICKKIGGTYNEGILNFVPATGSSFDGTKYMGRGTEMKVLERWRWFLTEEGEPFQHYLSLRPNILEYYMDHKWLSDEKKEFCESLMIESK